MFVKATGTQETGGGGGAGGLQPTLFCSCMMSRLRHSIQKESRSPFFYVKIHSPLKVPVPGSSGPIGDK